MDNQPGKKQPFKPNPNQKALDKLAVLEGHLSQAMDGFARLVKYDRSKTKTLIDDLKAHLSNQ
jgi:hypothetical protein